MSPGSVPPPGAKPGVDPGSGSGRAGFGCLLTAMTGGYPRAARPNGSVPRQGRPELIGDVERDEPTPQDRLQIAPLVEQGDDRGPET